MILKLDTVCFSPHPESYSRTGKDAKMLLMHQCITSEDNQRYQKASAPEINKSRRALLFEEKMSRGGFREIDKTTSGSKKASTEQLPAVSSNPSSTGQQVILSGRSFKGQKNTYAHNMQVICGLPWQRPFVRRLQGHPGSESTQTR